MSAINSQQPPNRRRWIVLLGGTAVAALFTAQARLQAQNPSHPTGSEPASQDEDDGKLKPSQKLILEANEKDIKKNVEKLFQLATELKAEVDKTNSSQVLSLAMVRKTEEIEKLAKEIRSRAKG
jgi:hypothetical protein